MFYYVNLIKAADVLANLYETADDIKNGRQDGEMKRSLEKRINQFDYRVGKIKEVFDVFQAQIWLEILKNHQ